MKNIYTLLIFAAMSAAVLGQTVKIGSTSYSTISAALNAANTGDVIDITGIHTETLVIKKGVTLKGSNPSVDVIRAAALPGEATKRVIYIYGGGFPEKANVTIENLSILNGVSGNNMGGGIFVDKVAGYTKLENLIISENQSGNRGGGIAVAGSIVDINYCTISFNSSSGNLGFGGGAFIAPNNGTHNAVVNINNSVFNNNTSEKDGGALYIDGNKGFGDKHYIDVNFKNSIIAFNTAPNGIGAVFMRGEKHTTDNEGNVRAQFRNVTIAYNQAKSTEVNGLRFYGPPGAFPKLRMYNSIISLNGADNVWDVSFNYTVTSHVVNCIFGKAYGVIDFVANSTGTELLKFADDIHLSNELKNKGGKTLVLPIGAKSLAIDFGDPDTATESDIRDKSRSEGEAPDVGAYEFVQPTAMVICADKSIFKPGEEIPLKVTYTPTDADAVPLIWGKDLSDGGGQVLLEKFSSTAEGNFILQASSLIPNSLMSNEFNVVVSDTPVLEDIVFSGDIEICNGLNTLILIKNSQQGVPYSIKNLGDGTYFETTLIGDGSDLSIPTDNLLYSQSPYNIAVEACARELTNKPQITIKPSPLVVLTSNVEEDLFCVGTSVALQATEGLSNYIFILNNEGVQTDGGNIFISSFLDGDRVKVRATNSDGCTGVSNQIVLKVNPISGLWTGVKDSDWTNQLNWCNGEVPSQESDITISAVGHPAELSGTCKIPNLTVSEEALLNIMPGAKLDVCGDLTVHALGRMVLNSNTSSGGLASLITKGFVTGVVDVELTVPSRRWFYLSSPMNPVDYSHFGAENDAAAVFVYRNNRWVEYLGETTQKPLLLEGATVGFVSHDPTAKICYSGDINNGEVSRVLKNKGYHLFGNPYTAPIDWETISSSHSRIYSSMWYRTKIINDMAYITYNSKGPDGGKATLYPDDDPWGDGTNLALIPPYQSVWIYSKTASETDPVTVSVSPNQRVHGGLPITLKSSRENSSADVLRIMVENENSRDGAVIYFSEDATEDFDSGDSQKFFNDSKLIPEVYTRSAGQSMAINGLAPFKGSFDMPLSVRNRVEGSVDLNFNLTFYRSNDVILLHDKILNKEINLRKVQQYRYEPIDLGDSHDRFVIRFNPEGYEDYDVSTFVDEKRENIDDCLINIIQDNEHVIVSIDQVLLQEAASQIEVFNVKGSKISEFIANVSETTIVLPESSGTYFVVVKAGRKIKREKLIK